jgi:hypothetical protein
VPCSACSVGISAGHDQEVPEVYAFADILENVVEGTCFAQGSFRSCFSSTFRFSSVASAAWNDGLGNGLIKQYMYANKQFDLGRKNSRGVNVAYHIIVTLTEKKMCLRTAEVPGCGRVLVS